MMNKCVWTLLLLLLPITAAAGSWTLDGSKSGIQAVSVKKGSVAEVHHFKSIAGEADNQHATVTIDLASIESGIDIRNQRMKSMLFEVGSFPSATITADISAVDVSKLKRGHAVSLTLPVLLELHGFKKALDVRITIVSLEKGLLIASRSPVIIKASDFGLSEGIEALRKVASLPSIARAVPVTFELFFIQAH